ncbi:PQ loop repeat-domain-containing protein [Phlyctochytrium arcticum]|nr:PQ loop repeat-domain-containing protein [Phlyctochytrium arcticum]
MSLEALSPIIGWAYFLAWSVSFYPQVLLNYRRKSVDGLSLDFVYLNLWGFLCYATFNVVGYAKAREWDMGSSIKLNDVVFAGHALLLTIITAAQSKIYPSSQRLSLPAKTFLVASFAAAVMTGVSAVRGGISLKDWIYYLSYIKIGVSIVKYLPQVWLNYRRRSTEGWSMGVIMLDWTGGVLSFLQVLIDAGTAGVVDNPVKVGLGLLSIGFDAIFFGQWLWYGRGQSRQFHKAISDEELGRGSVVVVVEDPTLPHEASPILAHKPYSYS